MTRPTVKQWLANYQKPSIRVTHATLEQRDDEEGPFRRKCPVCPDGLLLVGRDQKTLRILATDHCIVCGQRVEYTDEAIDGWPVQR